MNVKEAAAKAGVSARTLRYYEEKGLIRPKRDLENGYRDYDEEIIERVRMIRAYRELHFSLEEIRILLDAGRIRRDEILQKQLGDLEKRRSELDHRITLIKGIRMIGPARLGEIDFSTVDEQMDEAQHMLEENENIKKYSDLTDNEKAEFEAAGEGLIEALANVANAEEGKIEAAIAALKNHIEENFYPCTNEILLTYARSFGGDGMLSQLLEDTAGKGSPERLRKRLEGSVRRVK